MSALEIPEGFMPYRSVGRNRGCHIRVRKCKGGGGTYVTLPAAIAEVIRGTVGERFDVYVSARDGVLIAPGTRKGIGRNGRTQVIRLDSAYDMLSRQWGEDAVVPLEAEVYKGKAVLLKAVDHGD